MTTTKKVPIAACRVRDFVTLDIAPPAEADAGGDGKPKQRTFSMVANTGKVLRHPWYGNLGIDLQGIHFSQQLPALLDHMTNQRVGYTTKVELTKAGLTAAGVMLGNEHAQTVLADAGEGFPWQASVRLEPIRVEMLEAGQKAKVNGQEILGPAQIMRESTLREVTFCTLGADDQTTAAALADSGDALEAVFFSAITKEPETMNPTELAAAVLALSAVQLSTMHPDAAKQLRAEGAELERARVAAILGAADSEQAELAQQLVAEGVELTAALAKLGADLREKVKAIRLAAAAEGRQARTALGGGNGGEEGNGGAGGASAADVELRASFPEGEKGDKLFAAYKRNEHRTRTYKATKNGDE